VGQVGPPRPAHRRRAIGAREAPAAAGPDTPALSPVGVGLAPSHCVI
jgi:hypothetical protein